MCHKISDFDTADIGCSVGLKDWSVGDETNISALRLTNMQGYHDSLRLDFVYLNSGVLPV